jgi:hypothetical protein
VDYKLKNREGVETTYTKEKLKIPAATGDSMVVFTQGEVQSEKAVTITENGTTEVTPDAGYGSVKKVGVTVNVPAPVTSVNGKTGDVKTGMVVHATKNADGNTYALSPSVNEIIQFVNSNTPAPIQLLCDGIVFDKYLYNSEDKVFTFLDGEGASSALGRETYLFIISSDPDVGILIGLNNQYSAVFNFNIATSSVSVIPDESTISIMLSDNLVSWIVEQADMGVFPVVIVTGLKEVPFPCLFSIAETDDSGKNIKYFEFRSATWDGGTIVVKFTPSETGSLYDMFAMSVDETGMMIHYSATSNKGDKTYAEIKNAIINGRPVFCSVGSKVLLLSALSSSASESSNSDFVFSSSEIYGEQIYVTVAKVTSTDEWSVNTTVFLDGIQYSSPSGKQFVIQVADDGTLSTKEVTT